MIAQTSDVKKDLLYVALLSWDNSWSLTMTAVSHRRLQKTFMSLVIPILSSREITPDADHCLTLGVPGTTWP